MFHRALLFIRGRIATLSLRLSLWRLPPLATHALCLLLGTLLFQPVQGPPDANAVYWAWKPAAVSPKADLHRRYQLLSRGRDCALTSGRFQIWEAGQKLFVVLPRGKDGDAFVRAMAEARGRDFLLKEGERPLCGGTKGEGISYG